MRAKLPCISCSWAQTVLLRSKWTACSGQFQFSLQTNARHGSLCSDSSWSGRVTTDTRDTSLMVNPSPMSLTSSTLCLNFRFRQQALLRNFKPGYTCSALHFPGFRRRWHWLEVTNWLGLIALIDSFRITRMTRSCLLVTQTTVSWCFKPFKVVIEALKCRFIRPSWTKGRQEVMRAASHTHWEATMKKTTTR